MEARFCSEYSLLGFLDIASFAAGKDMAAECIHHIVTSVQRQQAVEQENQIEGVKVNPKQG